MVFAELRASRRIETGGSSYLAKLHSRPGVLPFFSALASTVFHCIQLHSSGRESAETASHVEPSARNRETPPHPHLLPLSDLPRFRPSKSKFPQLRNEEYFFGRISVFGEDSHPSEAVRSFRFGGREPADAARFAISRARVTPRAKEEYFSGPVTQGQEGGAPPHQGKENGGTNAAISDLPRRVLCRAIRRSPSSARTRPGSSPRPPARRARPSMPRGRHSASGRPPPWGRERASRRPRA